MTSAAIGLGANLGHPEATFHAALEALQARDGVRVEAISSLWRSAPWGRADQPDFLNAVALVRTSLSPRALLRVLLNEELRAGRVRVERWGPRILDLDLLFHGRSAVSDVDLTLPHPRIAERSFVLAPLAEVAPTWRDPESGRTVEEMLDSLHASTAWTDCRRVEGARLGAGPFPEPACPR